MAKTTKEKVIKEKSGKITKEQQDDNLAFDVLSIINKQFKEFPDAAQFLCHANMVPEWISTGCDILDLAISNRPDGGLPCSKVVEMSGLEGSSKSLLAAHVLAECQKKGGIAVLYDTEGAVGMLDFYKSIGLDIDKLIYIDKVRALEEIYSSIESIIEKTVLANKDVPVVIVVDSVMGATTLKELEEDYEKKGYATEKSIINSGAMRKMPSLLNGRKILLILINQLRANMNAVGFGADPYQVTGGNAIPFTASVRLRFKKMGQIKGKINGIETSIGERIQVQIVKNRVGPPRRKVVYDIRYESGIDNYGSWLTVLKDLGALSSSGSSYSYKYVNEHAEEITVKFQSKDFKKLLRDTPGLKDLIYSQICDAYIMKYELGDNEEELGIDDVVLDSGEEE